MRKTRTTNLLVPDHLLQDIAHVAADDPERLFALLLAGLAGVLYRYAGAPESDTVLIGVPQPISSRTSTTEPYDVLALSIKLEQRLAFNDLVTRVTECIADSYEHLEFSTEQLIQSLGVSDIQNRHPLFSVVLRLEGYHAPIPVLRNDITVIVPPLNDFRSLALEYNASVYDEAITKRFGEHLIQFIMKGLSQPNTPLDSLDYISSDERRHLLVDWSGDGAHPVDTGCLHELFAEHAARFADQEALVWGDQVFSYSQVNRSANKLANYLRRRGVKRGSRVGLCLPPGPNLLTGLLGIVKSGATVVPLVPSFPAIRNAMTIADSLMEMAITESPLQDRFDSSALEIVCMDVEEADISHESDNTPATGLTQDDPLYILFTSGSTGRPKGVVMHHKVLTNLCLWQHDRSNDLSGKRTLQRTSIGFDVSFQEIFSTLSFGGSLVIAPDDVRDDVSLLPEFIQRFNIARLFLPPVALDQLAASVAIQQYSLSALKEVIVAGEQLQISMATRRFFHETGCTLDNQYGPTETHVVTANFLEGPSTRWPEYPPIGAAIRNVQVYALDHRLQPVPIGVPGEICIGGLAVARGYLREDDNRGTFTMNPFSSAAGGRMYRTGDIGRLRTDGTIEFLGRFDHQIKIRGYRIELGEIEANLLRLNGIRHAATVVHETETLGKQLAAYVITETRGHPDASSIRQFLLERLPAHMVPSPSHIVHMDSFPTTATGKVDRRSLPVPVMQTQDLKRSVNARGEIEEAVAATWRKALAIPYIGRDDNFLDLGGHSIIAIQIVSQLNEFFSVALPLRHLLRGTTVAALALEIKRLKDGKSDGLQEHLSASGPPAASSGWDDKLPIQRIELPNGARIACLQKAEAEYLYLDVFEHKTYDHGCIQYPSVGCVFDVGAHIGLFTLYALEKSPQLQVFAFEPCPPLFEVLRMNTSAAPSVRLYPIALSNTRGTAPFTFYQNLTGMSSFYADEEQDRELLLGILKNMSSLNERDTMLALSNDYLKERLLASTFVCDKRTFSDIFSEAQLQEVDLLKIDVQRAELEVLEGIAPEHWPKIKQLAIEIHDVNGRLRDATSLLNCKDYRVTVTQDQLHTGTVVHFIYACRNGARNG